MTLIVSAHHFDGARWCELPLERDLAGFEKTRHTFYGSPWAVNLGLQVLPLLRNDDVFVSGDDLATLRLELQTLLRAIVGRVDEQYWTERLTNISSAIDIASRCGADGAVSIS